VLVEDGGVVWVDLVIPAGDRLWLADVGEAAWWVGRTWAAALDAVASGPAHVWRGAMQRTPWSDRVCFAALAAGAACVGARKAVGASQRRTRVGALFQTAALLQWDPTARLSLLRLDEGTRRQGGADLASVAAGVGPERAGARLAAFRAGVP